MTGRKLHRPIVTLLSLLNSLSILHLLMQCAPRATICLRPVHFPSTILIRFLAVGDSQTLSTHSVTQIRMTLRRSRMKISSRKTNFPCSSQGNWSLPAWIWNFPLSCHHYPPSDHRSTIFSLVFNRCIFTDKRGTFQCNTTCNNSSALLISFCDTYFHTSVIPTWLCV